jgi:uncharacterized protein YjbI with pentapeptide repeats
MRRIEPDADETHTLKGASLEKIDLTEIVKKAAEMVKEAKEKKFESPTMSVMVAWLDLSGCYLRGAKLDGLQFHEVDFSNAELRRATMKDATFTLCMFSHTALKNANISRGKFIEVDASDTQWYEATLDEAIFSKSKLNDATFSDTSARKTEFKDCTATHALFREMELGGAKMLDTDVEGAHFQDADLSEVTWEAHGKPDLAMLARNEHLETLRFDNSEIGLVELRKAFMEAGIRGAERKVNYALQRARTDHLWNDGLEGRNPTVWDRLARNEVGFRKVFFDWTCRYGLDPGRALRFIAYLCGLCAIPYAAAMFQRPRVKQNHSDWQVNAPPDTSQSGIWAIPLEKRVSSGSSDPALVHVDLEKEGWAKGLCRALTMGLFFSVISAFSTGYKDLDVGRWIERIKRNETTLRGTGWVRVVSGLQSLASFYLLALWLLAYFGRPFE